MALNVDIDMRVDPESEVSMSVEDGDEVSFGVAEAIVVKDHATLENRDLPNQHPISAITGLAEALAESGKIDTVKVNGTALPVVNKAVDVPVPTTTSQLTNNSGFITESDIPVTSVNGMTGDVVVSGLPSATEDGTALVYVDGEWTNQTGYGYTATETGAVWSATVTTTAYNPQATTGGGTKYPIVVGDEYTMSYDDVEYTLQAEQTTISFEGSNLTVNYIGNALLLGLPTSTYPSCPFVFGYILEWNMNSVVTTTSGEHTFEVLGEIEVTHKIADDLVNVNSTIIEDALGFMPVSYTEVDQIVRGYEYTSNGIELPIFFRNGTYIITGAAKDVPLPDKLVYVTIPTTDNIYESRKVYILYHRYQRGDYPSTTYKFYFVHAEDDGGVSVLTLTANSRDASPEGTITTYPRITKTSDLTNDSGYITISDVPTPPVTSVNGRTGAVTGLAEASSLSSYMQKGVDYVTAGQKSGTTLGYKATAEGRETTSSGYYSHAEGRNTYAGGTYTHAEGYATKASGDAAHAEGYGTKANSKSQHVFGEYNIAETGAVSSRGTYVEIVGNGTADDARSNARTLDWSGNEVLAGTLTVGADPTNNMEVATKQYVDGAIPTVPTNVSSFTNDAGYLVASDLTEATDADVIAIVV